MIRINYVEFKKMKMWIGSTNRFMPRIILKPNRIDFIYIFLTYTFLFALKGYHEM
jgi:hypothetical protein